jgi:4-carboxymuconolactone decarboxylase
MSRHREIAPEAMSETQRRVYDMIVAGRRGRVAGPFMVLLRAPEVCEHAAKLGEHLRWGSSLPARLSELAIILTARSLRAQYEWHAHAPLAEKAGVPAAAIEAIRNGRTPDFTASDEALVYRIVSELQKTQRLSDASFAAAVETLGEQGLVEIIAIIGYYTLIGNTLNVFQVGLPPGATAPFAE